ncbi:hypothetical protein VC83_01819 [Pseudogymnoascus destructans]|uniref:CFEM domain-containing protein n=1 Tax=Pseudogymnoascus destructans TaxID=655981 RepID=A0A177AH28_9PEZI|nr:uncharacterized protein VC83_01819 [Pseudogymnoascus destructans]OAF61399.1 hypothetical protein VC83_01819 [Pseudogymnoascus destructans]
MPNHYYEVPLPCRSRHFCGLTVAKDCSALGAKGEAGSVFEPLENFCKCGLGNIKPTTSADPQPTETTSTRDAEQKEIPSCGVDCLNAEAYNQCEYGDPECACKPETLNQIVTGSVDCVAKACDSKVEVLKLLENWCKCNVGDSPSTSTTSARPTKSATTSEEPTKTATTEEPTETATTPHTFATTKPPVLPVITQTLTLTTTWYPEETDGPVPTGETSEEPAPTIPGPDTPIYPTTPDSPGTICTYPLRDEREMHDHTGYFPNLKIHASSSVTTMGPIKYPKYMVFVPVSDFILETAHLEHGLYNLGHGLFRDEDGVWFDDGEIERAEGLHESVRRGEDGEMYRKRTDGVFNGLYVGLERRAAMVRNGFNSVMCIAHNVLIS